MFLRIGTRWSICRPGSIDGVWMEFSSEMDHQNSICDSYWESFWALCRVSHRRTQSSIYLIWGFSGSVSTFKAVIGESCITLVVGTAFFFNYNYGRLIQCTKLLSRKLLLNKWPWTVSLLMPVRWFRPIWFALAWRAESICFPHNEFSIFIYDSRCHWKNPTTDSIHMIQLFEILLKGSAKSFLLVHLAFNSIPNPTRNRNRATSHLSRILTTHLSDSPWYYTNWPVVSSCFSVSVASSDYRSVLQKKATAELLATTDLRPVQKQF